MIKLELEKYCMNCLEFEADVKKPDILYYDNFFGESEKIVDGDTIVNCKNRDICKKLVEYLKNENAK